MLAPKTASRNGIEEQTHAWINGWWTPFGSLKDSGKAVLGLDQANHRDILRKSIAIAEYHANVDVPGVIRYAANMGLGTVKVVFGNSMNMDKFLDAEALELHKVVSELGLLNNSLQKIWDVQNTELQEASSNPLDTIAKVDTEDIKVDSQERAIAMSETIRGGISKLAGNKVFKGASKLYQVPSDAVRVMGFVKEKQRINEAIQWDVEQSLKGKNKTKVEIEEAVRKKQDKLEKKTNREAADLVKSLIPTASRIPPNVKSWSALPIFGNFPTWFTGYMGSMLNQWKIGAVESLSKNPKTKKVGHSRLLRATITQSALPAFASSLYMFMGYDDEDMEAARATMPLYQRNHTLIPIPDGDGGVMMFDVSQSFPSVMLFDIFATSWRGYEKEGVSGMLGDGIAQATSMYTDEDIFMGNINDLLFRGGETENGYKVYDSLDSGFVKTMKELDHVTFGVNSGGRGPLTPGLFPELVRIKQAFLDEETPSGIKRSKTGVIFRNLVGTSLESVVPERRLTMKAKEFRAAKTAYTRSLNKAGYSGSPTTFAKAGEAFNEKNATLYKEMGQTIHFARMVGMTDKEIYTELLKFGVPKTDIRHWLAGKVRGANMSDKTLRGIKAKSGDKAQEMMDIYRNKIRR